MPFEIALEKIANPRFRSAITKLHQFGGWPTAKVSYDVSKIISDLNKEYKTMGEEHTKVFKTYCKVDDKGNLVPASKEKASQFCPYEIKENKEEELRKKVEELMALKVKIERNPLPLDILDSVKLSPAEIEALDTIIQASS